MIDDIDAIENRINEKYPSSHDKRLVPDILMLIMKRLDRIESLIKSMPTGGVNKQFNISKGNLKPYHPLTDKN